MKGKKHQPEQIIKKLREADAMIAAGTVANSAIGHRVRKDEFATVHRRHYFDSSYFTGPRHNYQEDPKECCPSCEMRLTLNSVLSYSAPKERHDREEEENDENLRHADKGRSNSSKATNC